MDLVALLGTQHNTVMKFCVHFSEMFMFVLNKTTDMLLLPEPMLTQFYDNWPSWWWNLNIEVEIGWYHGCWCPGPFSHQAISSHEID